MCLPVTKVYVNSFANRGHLNTCHQAPPTSFPVHTHLDMLSNCNLGTMAQFKQSWSFYSVKCCSDTVGLRCPQLDLAMVSLFTSRWFQRQFCNSFFSLKKTESKRLQLQKWKFCAGEIQPSTITMPVPWFTQSTSKEVSLGITIWTLCWTSIPCLVESTASKPAAQICVRQLLSLHEHLHHVDKQCRHIALRRAALTAVKVAVSTGT